MGDLNMYCKSVTPDQFEQHVLNTRELTYSSSSGLMSLYPSPFVRSRKGTFWAHHAICWESQAIARTGYNKNFLYSAWVCVAEVHIIDKFAQHNPEMETQGRSDHHDVQIPPTYLLCRTNPNPANTSPDNAVRKQKKNLKT